MKLHWAHIGAWRPVRTGGGGRQAVANEVGGFGVAKEGARGDGVAQEERSRAAETKALMRATACWRRRS